MQTVTTIATQPVQNNPNLLFGRMTFAGGPANILYEPLRWQFSVYGFLSHLHSLMVTMSQKSSVPQAAKSVSQALMPDMARFHAIQTRSDRNRQLTSV